jgi:hypothetical protein
MSTFEDIAPLAPVLSALIDSSSGSLGDLDTLERALADLMGQYGVSLSDVRVVRTRLNPVATGHPELPEPARQYRYEAAFPDPHPDNAGELITPRAFSARDWEAPSFVRHADVELAELDVYGRRRRSTEVSDNAAQIFSGTGQAPQSVSAKRELAKRQEAERERLAAEARANA